ncbi:MULTISPECIES: hypothetical protein [Rhodopseudomonas]|nr:MULTISPECIES: hypothetical protein [Rhodopseudomonas]WOK20345.1 hypothetical protein RBJ75_12850 [Rhodopseudomonas sp. BAL398]
MLRLLVAMLLTICLIGCTETTMHGAAHRGALKPATHTMMMGVGY